MPNYEVRCPNCGRKTEIFTKTIQQADKFFEGINIICPKCNVKMVKHIFPHKVDVDGWARRT